MFRTREIPAERWGAYLRRLAEHERDHPVRLEIIGRDVGNFPMEAHAPLLDIELATKGSAEGSIEVTFGGPAGQLLEHRIEKPTRVYVEENAAGEVEVLDIESREQRKTLLVFEHPMVLEA